jgi:hypothetical protein
MTNIIIIDLMPDATRGHYISNLKHLVQISQQNKWKISILCSINVYRDLQKENLDKIPNLVLINSETIEHSNIVDIIKKIDYENFIIFFPWWKDINLELVKSLEFEFSIKILKFFTILTHQIFLDRINCIQLKKTF